MQGLPKECFPSFVNFVTAVAYHFCLTLPRAFSQPGKHSFGNPCTYCLKINALFLMFSLFFIHNLRLDEVRPILMRDLVVYLMSR